MVFYDEPVDSPELYGTEAKVPSQRDRVQPEFCRLIVSIHMNVGRLVRLMAVEIHTVRSRRQYGWHAFSISPLQARIPAHAPSV